MDNLTHSLTGALLGQAGLKRKTGLAMPALIIGANLPDIDAACFFWLDGVEHLAFRRGITHGPIAWVLLPLILAGLLWGFDRWQTKRGKRPESRLPVNFKWLFLLSFIGCLTHPALDWMNVYGIRLLEPFSSQWFYGDVLFIIDVWLWALMGFATWFSLRREKRGGEWMKPARVAIAVGLAYIGVNAGITASSEHEAHSYVAEQFAQSLADEADISTIELGVARGIEDFRSVRELPNGGFRFDRFPEFPESDQEIRVIAMPVPIAFWARDVIYGHQADWQTFENFDGVIELLSPYPIGCFPPETDLSDMRASNPQLDAFLFWSRAPFATQAEDGSIIVSDARYDDLRAAGQFSVVLPEVECALQTPLP